MDEADSTAAYAGTWYATTKVDTPPRPSLQLDLDVDICVIGGGLAGLTTTRELARDGRSVVLIEAGHIAAAASGRNTGFVLPGFGADADTLVARVGFERTRDLWTLAQAGLDYVRNAVQADGAAAVEPQDGWLHVSKKDNSDEFVDYVGLLGELGCEIEGWPTERVRAVLRSERYFYAINYLRAFTIHPLNYALALAAAAVTTARQFLSRSPKILDTVTFAFFVFAAIGVIGFGWMALGTYMTLLVNVTLMAIAWGSLLAGTPFTIQYAREQVSPELWRSPLFIQINQYITAVWGLDFFLSALVSLYRHATGTTGLASQYAWVLFSVGAALFTVYFPDWYRARALRPAGSRGSSGL